MQRKDWAARVDGLVVFRGLLSAAPFAALRTALAADAADLTGAVAAFESTLFLQGTNWTEVLLDAVLEDENLCLRTAAGGDAGPVLEKALEMELDRESYASLCDDLAKGKRLLYLTDNAGEIGFDRVFAEQLQKAYPHLQITFCVRGGPAQNDATREDAAAVGIPFPVIDNGNTVAGTDLALLSAEAKAALDAADVIISKGQGNAETLLGCGYNIYYAFLVKCARFIDRYHKPKLTPMLVKERV